MKHGARALFTSMKSADPTKRDCFILGDGRVVELNELPHRLKLKVIAVPVSERSRKQSSDLEVRVEELEEDLVLV